MCVSDKRDFYYDSVHIASQLIRNLVFEEKIIVISRAVQSAANRVTLQTKAIAKGAAKNLIIFHESF